MMMPGIDPQRMAKVQAVSSRISGEITVSHSEGVVNLKLSSDDIEAQALIPNLVEQFSQALAQQLSAIFAIKGEIIEKE